MTIIEEGLEAEGEEAVVFFERFLIPWLRVGGEPLVALLLEFFYDSLRERIQQAPCDKDHGFSLLPVREVPAVALDFFVWVEEHQDREKDGEYGEGLFKSFAEDRQYGEGDCISFASSWSFIMIRSACAKGMQSPSPY